MSSTRATLAAVALLVSACGGADGTAAGTTSVATTLRSSTSVAAATSPASTSVASPTTTTGVLVSSPVTPGTASDADWRRQVTTLCRDASARVVGIQPNDGTPAAIAAEATATKAVYAQGSFQAIDFPPDVQATAARVEATAVDAVRWLDSSLERAAAGDVEAAQHDLDEGFDRFSRISTAWAVAGATCAAADPARVNNADLTVALEMDPWQVGVGFGSIWVSERLADRVVRLDPVTGAIQASIDVGGIPFKLQASNGAIWVRTAAAYEAIDPTTNTVTAILANAAVGPSADRSWAVDGAMWICDGQRLHRYDPTTLTLVATIAVGVDCSSVYATADLVVAWNYNEDVGQSGASVVAFVDPAGNALVATVALPVDVGGPAILTDSVVFPGYLGDTAVVVDRATWTVTATPNLGTPGGGSGQAAYDGASIFIVAADEASVLVVDATTLTATGVIEPLGVNAVAIDGTTLWTVGGQRSDAAQRFGLQ